MELRWHLRIATRKSQLALWQANWVKTKLEASGHVVELVHVETQGDKVTTPFAQMEGQGFFTKAVQEAVLDGRADLAVHSYKDLPSAPTPMLEVAAMTQREDARDVLLIHPDHVDEKMDFHIRAGAVVGTSAVRRQKQLEYARPDLSLKELRGNVPRRVDKLREGQYDAVVLAAAGLKRLELDLSDLVIKVLEPQQMVPAPAQGTLALETKRDAYEVASILTELHDMQTYKAVAAERGLMAMLQGGCQLALGAYATYENGLVRLSAWYEGHYVEVENPSSESAAMLAFDALGRPSLEGV